MSRRPDELCDRCQRAAAVVCDKCAGVFCAECAHFVPKPTLETVEANDGRGQILCYLCDGAIGAVEHQRRMGGGRT